MRKPISRSLDLYLKKQRARREFGGWAAQIETPFDLTISGLTASGTITTPSRGRLVLQYWTGAYSFSWRSGSRVNSGTVLVTDITELAFVEKGDVIAFTGDVTGVPASDVGFICVIDPLGRLHPITVIV